MSDTHGHARAIFGSRDLFPWLLAVAAAPSLNIGTHGSGEDPRWGKWKRPAASYGFVPANINRHTGRPHEHKREIARRQRQAARA